MTPVPGVAAAMDHPCASWVNAVRGRAGAQTNGSFVVWSRRTAPGVGLVVSATHTLGIGWFGPADTAVSEGFAATDAAGVMRLFVPDPAGALTPIGGHVSPLFDLFHLAIPANENTGNLSGILPQHDVFVGLVDKQRLPVEPPLWPIAGPREDGLVPLFDPAGATLAGEIADPMAGDQLMVIGFPQGMTEASFSVGPVLDEAEVASTLTALAAAGDEEGTVAHDPDVEIVVRANAAVGMSGGGAFDRAGRFVGTLVRASTTSDVPQVVRVVRMRFVDARLRAAFDALDPATQAAIAPLLDGAH